MPAKSRSQNFLTSSFNLASASEKFCNVSSGQTTFCKTTNHLQNQPLELGHEPTKFDLIAAKSEQSFFLTSPLTNSQYKLAPINISV